MNRHDRRALKSLTRRMTKGAARAVRSKTKPALDSAARHISTLYNRALFLGLIERD